MTDDSEAASTVEQLAESFVERFRRGERPPISEYTRRYPELASQIQDVFPALVMIEQVQQDLQPDQVSAGSHPVASFLTTLGDFRILREVGRGGMGVVFEAEQVSLGRRVALKVLSGSLLADHRHRKRFEREARAAARLHHTNIVPVFGVGEENGVSYYVMQFIQGLGLDEVLTELKKLPLHAGHSDNAQAAQQPPQAEHVAAAQQAGNPQRIQSGDGHRQPAHHDSAISATSIAASLLHDQFTQTALLSDDAHGDSDSAADGLQQLPAQNGRRMTDTAILQHSDTATHSRSFALPGEGDPKSSGSQGRHQYWQSVARVGVQVASALHYAHDQGVIHRDIKPANLLLDMRGTVWVADFGLAKASDQQDLTHTGDVLGTLRYMAPEQFDGQADPRSDLYSLGLTLYELLALRPAFDEVDRQKLIKQVTGATPPRLRQLDPSIPRDLETIVHKAIDRDPAHRYQSAKELAADLSRYLGDEPIKARRISPLARFRRWCRKNPAVAALTSTIAILITTAAVVASISAVKFEKLATDNGKLAGDLKTALGDAERNLTLVREQEQIAQQNLTLANTEKQRAEEALALANERQEKANANLIVGIKALDTVFMDFIANRRTMAQVENGGTPKELTSQEKEMLQSGLAFYQQLADTNTDNESARFSAATARIRMAMIQSSLGDYEGAKTHLTSAITNLEPLVAKAPENARFHGELGRAYYNLAMTSTWPKGEAETLQKAEVALSAAIQQDSQDVHLFTERAEVRRWLGRSKESFSDRRRAVELDSNNGKLRATLAFSILFSAAQGGEPKSPTEALEHAAKAVELAPQSSYPHAVLARCLASIGKNVEAMVEANLAVTLDPKSSFAYAQRGQIYKGVGRLEEALQDANSEVELNPTEYSRRHRANTLRALGRYAEALDEFDRISEVERGRSFWYWAERADLHLARKEYQKAIDHLNMAFDISPGFHYPYKRRAVAYLATDRPMEALQDLKTAFELNSGDLSTLTWIPPSQVAACPHQEFKEGMLQFATEAIEKNPAARSHRAVIATHLGRRDIAREDLTVLTQSSNARFYDLYQLAMLSLADNCDVDGYRVVCSRMLERFADSSDQAAVSFTGWTCALAPDALADYTPALALAERGVQRAPQDPEMIKALGALLYRNGQFAQAVQQLEPICQADESSSFKKSSAAYAMFLLAMAQQQNQQPDAARATLARAIALADDELSAETVAWNRKMTLDRLRQEAEALINPGIIPAEP